MNYIHVAGGGCLGTPARGGCLGTPARGGCLGTPARGGASVHLLGGVPRYTC